MTTLVTANRSTVALNTGVTGVLLLLWFSWLPVTIGITLGGGGQGVQMASNIFIPKNRFFLATGLNRGNKNGGESGENAFMYIKGRFKQIIPLYVTSFLRKLKFLISMADSPPPQCCYPSYAYASHSVTSSDVFTAVFDQMIVLFWVSGRCSGSITTTRRRYAQPTINGLVWFCG